MTVVYIMGSGRSGSTVLDAILGNHPKIQSGGELLNLVGKGWIQGQYCACGRRVTECPFWSEVQNEWIARVGRHVVKQYIDLQRHHERWWMWPQVLRGRMAPSLELVKYWEHTAALFAAISKVSGKSTIVDSSKNPLRGLALGAMPGFDVRFIHLVRDARAVAWSLKRGHAQDEQSGIERPLPARPVWRSTSFWMLVNIQAELVLRYLDRAVWRRIRYEDLVTAPGRTMTAIGQWLDLDLGEIGALAGEGAPIGVDHIPAGGRVRMQGTLVLRPDSEWKLGLTPREHTLVWALGSLLMSRYGYRR